ncbi:MAG TPA: EcsC family protein [Candidatus Saccharimonadales bacterium]|nr:EcsC family protein [Candidatus Saccharimonadales bacterium]
MHDTVENNSWIARRLEVALKSALTRTYQSVRVHPDEFLMQLRTAHAVPVSSYEGMFSMPVAELDSIAEQTIRGAMKMAGAEGAGLGFGGFATIVPDLGILSAITMRTVQKLSLIYGFEYNTDEEIAELWIAAATAAGVDISKELLERTVLKSFVQRVIGRMAARFSTEFAEKIVARAIPILSSVVGAVLNYYFVRAWGRRALVHFRQRHLEERSRRAGQITGQPILLGSAPASNG